MRLFESCNSEGVAVAGAIFLTEMQPFQGLHLKKRSLAFPQGFQSATLG